MMLWRVDGRLSSQLYMLAVEDVVGATCCDVINSESVVAGFGDPGKSRRRETLEINDLKFSDGANGW